MWPFKCVGTQIALVKLQDRQKKMDGWMECYKNPRYP